MLYNYGQKLRLKKGCDIVIVHQVTNSYSNYNYNAFVYSDIRWFPHFHGNFELIYALSGNVDITVNGESCNLSQGELILISPYNIHSLKIYKESKIWVGVFSVDFVSSFFKKNKNIRYSKFCCDKSVENFLKEKLFFQGTPEHYFLMGCLYIVLNECIKNAAATDCGKDNDFMYGIIDYISQNLCENISLEDISDALGYERHYFSSVFHKCFSMNFRNFVNLFRFEKVCNLLVENDMPITQISSECGFGSIRSFNRIFKEMSGKTPGEYRNKR